MQLLRFRNIFKPADYKMSIELRTMLWQCLLQCRIKILCFIAQLTD